MDLSKNCYYFLDYSSSLAINSNGLTTIINFIITIIKVLITIPLLLKCTNKQKTIIFDIYADVGKSQRVIHMICLFHSSLSSYGLNVSSL